MYIMCVPSSEYPVSRSGRAGQSRRAGCVFYLFIFIYCFLNFLTFVNKIFVGHTVLNISIPIRRSLYGAYLSRLGLCKLFLGDKLYCIGQILCISLLFPRNKVNISITSFLLFIYVSIPIISPQNVTCRLYTPLYYRIGGRVRRQHYTWSTRTAGSLYQAAGN